ncbi:ATP-binding protein [Flammeovirga sp. SubArs3]|uniref:hybrid sensor histidine kinase/response regulator transcription factor n=1 Tax=Flammeovirga sp. SubArs3 TaxID=2995316 RepID=UPI00248C7DBA|nr:ATP-binding protein [Flammeovirga sp. SubArs3]
MKYIYQVIFLVLYLLTPINSLGVENFEIQKLTVSQGLAHSDVRGICQDDYGFLWIATLKGLSMFNGKEVTNFQYNQFNKSDFPTNRIIAMKKGKGPYLYLLLENHGISIFNTDDYTIKNFHLLNDKDNVNLLDLRTMSLLYMDGYGDKLFLASRKGFVYQVNLDANGKPVQIEKLKIINDLTKKDYRIRSILADDDGNLWVCSRNGLYLRQKGDDIKKVNFKNKNIIDLKKIFKINKDNYLIGTNQSAYKFNLKTGNVKRILANKKINEVTGFLKRENNELWIGTNNGIWIKPEHGKPRHLIPDESSMVNRISVLYKDNSNSLWIGCNAIGVRYINTKSQVVDNIPLKTGQEDGIKKGFITSISKIDNYLLIGSMDTDLYFYDLNKKEFTTSRVFNNSNFVTKILVTKDRRIWIGTRNNGLKVSKKPFTSIADLEWINARNEIKNAEKVRGKISYIQDLFEDKYNNLWVSSHDLPLFRYNISEKTVQLYEGYDNNEIQVSNLYYEPKKDLIWLSTMNYGLFRLTVENDKIKSTRHYKSNLNDATTISSNYTWSVVRDFNDKIWVGTIGGGLNLLKDEEKGIFEKLNATNSDSDIECLLVDTIQKKIWYAGGTIASYDPQTKENIIYSRVDGVKNENGFKVGADYLAEDGIMYFGGVENLSFIDPNKLIHNNFNPTINLTSLSVNESPVHIGQEVDGRVILEKGLHITDKFVLGPDQKNFNISFIAIYPSAVNQVEYQYKLEGYDSHWIRVNKGENKVYFSNLPSGEYTFNVRTRISNGEWSIPATVKIKIEKPFWKQWYFILTLIIVVMVILVIININYLRQQKLAHKLEITELEREKDQELIDQKLKFYTNISHELRTPLTLMKGPLEDLVSNHSIKSSLREKVLLAYNQTNKLLDLVNQLLDFRKIENEKIQLNLQNGNFYDFIHEIFTTFNYKAKSKQIDYKFTSKKGDYIMAFDKSKMETVFMNLLSNAFKFTEEGGAIKLKLNTFEKDNQPTLSITVEDNGLGIDEKSISKIFDRFYQTGNANSIRISGSGIGLSIAKEIIEVHEGSLSVTSKEAVGTTFVIELPMKTVENNTSEVLPENYFIEDVNLKQDEEENQKIEGAKILIVEDNTDIRNFIINLFEGSCEVLDAENGQEALNIIKKDKEIDLIISDIMMPVMDGLDFCKHVKKDPDTWHIPIFLLTARTSTSHELEGLEYGADMYITKPFSPAILKKTVYNTLKHRKRLSTMYNDVIKLQKPISLYEEEKEGEFLKEMVTIVEKYLSSPDFKVHTIVTEMGMSQSVLYKKLKEVTGKSIIEFVKDIRMRKAGELLLKGDKKVFEIADEVGIGDIKYFRKCFKEHYGMSSTEYMKKMKSFSEETQE